MKIKVCGMRDNENIKRLSNISPDYIGFIFYSKSKRFIGNASGGISNSSYSSIKKTGVFVNEDVELIRLKIKEYGLQAIQLHGDESPELCASLAEENIEVIKAFGMDEHFDFEKLKRYEGSVNYFLFDTKTDQYGGSGKIFNWKVLEKYQLDLPYFLSGGLSLENLPSIKEISDERLYAIDLNSKFEIEPGLKDIEKLKVAFEIIKPSCAAIDKPI